MHKSLISAISMTPTVGVKRTVTSSTESTIRSRWSSNAPVINRTNKTVIKPDTPRTTPYELRSKVKSLSPSQSTSQCTITTRSVRSRVAAAKNKTNACPTDIPITPPPSQTQPQLAAHAKDDSTRSPSHLDSTLVSTFNQSTPQSATFANVSPGMTGSIINSSNSKECLSSHTAVSQRRRSLPTMLPSQILLRAPTVPLFSSPLNFSEFKVPDSKYREMAVQTDITYHYLVNSYDMKIAKLNELAHSLKEEKAQLQTEISKLETKNKFVTIDLEKIRENLESLKRINIKLGNEVRRLKRKSSSLDEELDVDFRKLNKIKERSETRQQRMSKVLIIGDSHARDMVKVINENTNDRAVVAKTQPGAGAKQILEGNNFPNMNKNDSIIIFAGANDAYDKNTDIMVASSFVKDFVSRHKHTNVIICAIPSRKDKHDAHVINRKIYELNIKLYDIAQENDNCGFFNRPIFANREKYLWDGTHFKWSYKEELGRELAAVLKLEINNSLN